MTFLMLFIINDAVATVVKEDFLSELTKLFNERLEAIQKFGITARFNTTTNYSHDKFRNRLSSLSCYDDKGIRKCIADTYSLPYKLVKWESTCELNMDFSNYESKNSEIHAGLSLGLDLGFIVITLLKSKIDNRVFIDLSYSNRTIVTYAKLNLTQCEITAHHSIEVSPSMWNDNKKPKFFSLFESFDILYQSYEGIKMYRTFFLDFNNSTTQKVFSEFSWKEIDLIRHDMNEYAVYSEKYNSLTGYGQQNSGDWVQKWKLTSENMSLLKPQDLQIHVLDRMLFKDIFLITLTSLEERRTELVLLDRNNSRIKLYMTIDLETNVHKVLMDIGYDNDVSKIDLFQSQCNPETGDCRILRQEVNLQGEPHPCGSPNVLKTV